MTRGLVAPLAIVVAAINATQPATAQIPFTFPCIPSPLSPLQRSSHEPNDHGMTTSQLQAVHVVGGGLAGSEPAWQLAQAGVPVVLHEMRPLRATPVHKTDGYAELVCSNSFRSDDSEHNAVGLLHEEMRRLGSLIMRSADMNQVPAGGALAVD